MIQSLIPAEFNRADFVFLEGRIHGNYSYPNLFVNMYRLGVNKKVRSAVKTLRYSISNTAKEATSDREYVGNIDWRQALILNLSLGGGTLSPRRFVDFLALLESGNAIDGNGRRIPKEKLIEIFNEITQVRDLYRGEWLDADFKYLDEKFRPVKPDKNGEFWFCSSHNLSPFGNLNPAYKRRLETCLMEYRAPGINLNDWIRNATAQGLPSQNISNGDLYYWCLNKDNDSVARFEVGSGLAALCCGVYSAYHSPLLGARITFCESEFMARVPKDNKS